MVEIQNAVYRCFSEKQEKPHIIPGGTGAFEFLKRRFR
jgi:hypothetical protein